MSFFTMRWQDEGLALVDQLALPTRHEIHLGDDSCIACHHPHEFSLGVLDLVM